MILLIYREEVYNKETPKKGVADIDLAKHRNGRTGRHPPDFPRSVQSL
jgi:replicative DNA helicase